MKTTSIALATSVAALLVATGCGSEDDSGTSKQQAAQTVQCDGINECKGQSECASAEDPNGCQGTNDCKGQGFLSVSAEECMKRGGTIRGQQQASLQCNGANECKGQGDCASDAHGCQGQNDCKGQGFVNVPDEKSCADLGGTIAS